MQVTAFWSMGQIEDLEKKKEESSRLCKAIEAMRKKKKKKKKISETKGGEKNEWLVAIFTELKRVGFW